jgi:hypothetical protein
MRERWLWAAGLVGLALTASLALAPFLTIARFQTAAEEGRLDEVAALTDGPAVRASLKQQAERRLMAELKVDGELVENPLGGFALALAPSLAGGFAETLASPRAIAVLVTTADPPRTPIEAAYPPAPHERPPVSRWVEVAGPRDVRLRLGRRGAPPERACALVFAPRGLLRWRMVAIRLPPER